MYPTLKSCYVRLNRNFFDLNPPVNVLNYNSDVTENCERSDLSKTSDHKSSFSKFRKNNYSLRNDVKVNYSDDMTRTDNEVSDSEISYSSDSDDDQATQKHKRKKTVQDLSEVIPKQLSCLLCNKSFKTHLSYLSHQRFHESKPYNCILCRKKFEARQSFLNHMKKLHPEVEPFLCDYQKCEQNFKTQKLLEIHRKSHLKYMCKYCKKLFARKHHMKRHVSKIH